MKKYLVATALLAVVASPLAAQDTNAELKTKSGVIAPPPAGKGLVVFYRPGSMMGMALGCTVHEGSAEIARLGSGKYYTVTEEPGKHTYNTEGEAKDVLNLEVEPDETYFVKCKIGMGIMAGRANLSPSDKAAFAAKAKGLAIWTPKK